MTKSLPTNPRPVLSLVPMPSAISNNVKDETETAPITADATAALLMLIDTLHPVSIFCEHAEKCCTSDDLRRIESVVVKAQVALDKLFPAVLREVA